MVSMEAFVHHIGTECLRIRAFRAKSTVSSDFSTAVS